MTTVKEFHDGFYAKNILSLDETGNDFGKISSLWQDRFEKLRVCDIGCGAGSVTGELVKRGHSVYGTDIQVEALRRASARGLEVKVCDLNASLPFEDKYFDVVVALDVAEHVFDPVGLLLEVKRILKDDGYALIGIPQHFDLIQRIRMLMGCGIVTAEHLSYCSDYRAWNYIHLRLFTLSDIYELVGIVGFRIQDSMTLPIALAPFALPYRWGLKLASNRVSRRLLPNLFASGIRMRVKKALS